MPSEQILSDGLLMRTVRDERDIVAYVAFNSAFNNLNEGLNTDLLLRHYPGSRWDNFQLVEDERTGQIAATTCLIPWQLDFEGIPLRAAQLEQVLSHPDYRRHGLVRVLIKRFMQTVAEREVDISFIWGIPYYYRQYGYTYAIEGNTFESLPAYRIPAVEIVETVYHLRPARDEDIPALTELYRRSMGGVHMHLTRSPEAWRYLLEQAKLPVELLIDTRTDSAVGYIALLARDPSASIQVIESGVTGVEEAWAILTALKARAGGEIQIAWPRSGTLARLARGLGSVTQSAGQWLFHITNPAGFLGKIGPALERRLEGSDCAGLERSLVINLYRQAYRLTFRRGKLDGVDALGFVDSSMGADGGDLCIPPEAFTRLVLGFRGIDQLLDAWPDIVVKPSARPVIDALFPTIESYLYANYAFYG
jgi:predicted N-acetyltransferase YhbS